MLIVMQQGATEPEIQAVIDRMIDMGFNVHRSTGVIHTVLGGVGGKPEFDLEVFEVMEGVKEAHRIVSPYKLASRIFRPEGTVVRIGSVAIGGPRLAVIAGPGSVESGAQIERCAEIAAASGAQILRGAAPDEDRLRLLHAAAARRGLLAIAEVLDASQIPLVAQYADILQVGARNMQNAWLLRALGAQRKPVLLKRGISATIEEWLLSAEQILAGGNYDVILCERGIRTFEPYTRYTMDISAIPVVKKLSHLPIAAGADGLLLEIHPDPDHAATDGAQSLPPAQFEQLMTQLRAIAPALDRVFE